MTTKTTKSMSHEDRQGIIASIQTAGYATPTHLSDTLQGGIWRSQHRTTGTKVAIKSTNIALHLTGSARIRDHDKPITVNENIFNEINLLQSLSAGNQCPAGIVQYVDSFQSDKFYFLVMEDGGHSMFALVRRAHQLIKMDALRIGEWQRVCRVMFKQMVDSVAYLHRRNVCHFDISIENVLVNDSNISVVPTPQGQTIKFHIDESDVDEDAQCTQKPVGIQTKLCDFGLAERFHDVNIDTACLSKKYCGKARYMSPEVASQEHGEYFNAKANDVWCLGVCLYVMCIGCFPWPVATVKDRVFKEVMSGNLLFTLNKWHKLHYIVPEIYEILEACFQYEKYRISVEELQNSSWFL